ncbi:MAG: hypothetical protein ACLU37_10710 [Collinsella sp.]
MEAKYKTTAKLVIQACDNSPGVFGHGCVLLLQGIAPSTRSTVPRAWAYLFQSVANCNEIRQLGCKLIERDGARGSTLTAGERAIAVYEGCRPTSTTSSPPKPTNSSPASKSS